MAGCFYIPKPSHHNNNKKRRTKSLEELANNNNNQPITSPDSPDMTLLTNNKFSGKLGRLFRSKSEQILKSSPRSSPMNSPKHAPPRRRLLRVVRDDQQEGEEWENPHVIRRYSKGYWEEKQMEVSRLVQHSESQPYDVNTERTILKKSQTSSTASTDSDTETTGNNSPSINKHACFKDEVQVIEFIGKEKITKRVHYMHEMRLVDSNNTDDDGCESDDVSEGIKKLLKEERVNEFSRAKESLESVDESDEDSIKSDCYTNDSAFSSDTMSEDTTSGCYSDTDVPKKKQKKKRSKHLRVNFFKSSSSSSSDSGRTHKTDRRLLGLHSQDEVDVMDSDLTTGQLTLIPEQ